MSSRRRSNKADVALEELKKLKEKQSSRLDDFEDSDEDIYDYLEEEEYSKHVAKNRERAKRFIISDGIVDSTGYADDGEELWIQQQERTEKENIPKKSNKLTKKQQSRISSLLLKGASAPKQKKVENIRKTVMSADTLDSYLDDFDSNPFDDTIPISIPEPTSSSVRSAPLSIVSKPKNTTPVQETPQDDEDMEDMSEQVEPTDSENEAVSEPIDKSQKKLEFRAPEPKPFIMTPKTTSSTTPSVPMATVVPAPKKKAEPIIREDQSDWFRMCDDSTNTESLQSDSMETEDCVLPDNSSENSKHIFLLDATYERGMPGTVVLFGKYINPEEGNKQQSCCIRVENIYRTLYFLPRVFRATKERVQSPPTEDGKPGTFEEQWVEDNETPVSIRDVCEEFNTLRKDFGIKEFRAKPVKRNYCFTLPHIPREEHEYVKIQFKETAQTKNLSDFQLAGATYSHVFCVTQNLLERVILKQKLMGPQWITVHNYKPCDTKFSWCKHEWRVEDVSDVVPLSKQDAPDSPNLVVLSLKINTILNHKKQANEIVVVSAMVHSAVKMDLPTLDWEKSLSSFTAIRKLEGIPWPLGFQQRIKAQCSPKRQVHLCESEMALLNSLMNFITIVDPDVIVGHNYIGFDLDVMLHRMKANNISTWSKLGRLQRRHMPRLQNGAGGQRDSTWEERKISAGRLICDTYLASKDLAMIRQASYSLASLAKQQLHMVRYEINQDSLHEYYRNGFSSIPPGATSAKNQIQYLDDRNLEFLIKHSENDAFLQLSLMFKFQIIPLTKQLTNLSGNLWARSLTGSRAERIAFYLMHEFHNRKYITPDKTSYEEKTSRKKKPSYSGGLVLPPKRGFYDQLILLLDFNSLYPSLIQEYNICFTTLDPKAQYDNEGVFVPIDDVPEDLQTKGVLPMVLKNLIDRRRGVKQMIKTERDEIKLQQLDIRQKALKLTANSMYGCLGFPQSRFYAMPLAELITRKGREALRLSKTIAEEKLGYDVVYGDTDSIMVNTGTTDVEKAKEIASNIKKTINQKYTQLELDLDGIFKTMLLLKKKKYAALMIGPDGKAVRETKGLDLVRRDWCPLSKEIGNKVLDFILSGNPIDDVLLSIHEYLRDMAEKIYEIPLDKFVITKSLSKEPEQYAKSTPLPHVNVALALIQQGKSVRVGNHIPYVICKSLDEDISCSYAQRAYHPEHIQKAGGLLEIDFDWYLENQILAPIIRLCDPIDGTNPRRIAECLGIENSKLASRFSGNNERDDDKFFKPLALDDFERFKDAEPLILQCANCHTSFPFSTIVSKRIIKENEGEGCKETSVFLFGHTCTNDDCQAELEYSIVCNQLHLFIRKYIQKYYAGWFACDDPSCSHRTRTLYLKHGIPKCTILRCGGKMYQEYSSSKLYDQLCYLQCKFDYSKFKSQASPDVLMMAEAYAPFYSSLSKVVQQYMTLNAHNFVDCKQLFSCFSQLSIQ